MPLDRFAGIGFGFNGVCVRASPLACVRAHASPPLHRLSHGRQIEPLGSASVDEFAMDNLRRAGNVRDTHSGHSDGLHIRDINFLDAMDDVARTCAEHQCIPAYTRTQDTYPSHNQSIET